MGPFRISLKFDHYSKYTFICETASVPLGAQGRQEQNAPQATTPERVDRVVVGRLRLRRLSKTLGSDKLVEICVPGRGIRGYFLLVSRIFRIRTQSLHNKI